MPTAASATLHEYKATEAIPTSTEFVTTAVEELPSEVPSATSTPAATIGSHTLKVPTLTNLNAPLMTAPWPQPKATNAATNQTSAKGNVETVGDDNTISPNAAVLLQVGLGSVIMGLIVEVMLW